MLSKNTIKAIRMRFSMFCMQIGNTTTEQCLVLVTQNCVAAKLKLNILKFQNMRVVSTLKRLVKTR